MRRVEPGKGTRPGRMLRLTISVNGYPFVRLYDGTGARARKAEYVHRLVARAFHGPPPHGKNFACHRDDDRKNNVPGNIYWGDVHTNFSDAAANNRVTRGEAKWGAKLSPATVTAIREEYGSGALQRELSAKYGVGQDQISRVINRRQWRHL